MDSISLIGLTLGLAAILVGQVLEGGHLSSLLQPTAFMIVIGGTLGAVMLQSPLQPPSCRACSMAKWVFTPPPSITKLIERMCELEPYRPQGRPAGLESQIWSIARPLHAQGPAAAGRRRRAGAPARGARSRDRHLEAR
jgi:chemotaxis protein MotA